MTDIPLVEPLKITSGDYIQWKKSLADYPADTWTLTYAMLNADGKIAITADASGTDFLVTLTASVTAKYIAGVYNWQAYVTNGSQRVTVGTGEIEVLPNFSSLSAYDQRSHAKIVLDSIEAVIEKRATQDQQQYTIAGRTLIRTPIADLLVLRDRYKAIYASEQNAERVKNGGPSKNRIYVRI